MRAGRQLEVTNQELPLAPSFRSAGSGELFLLSFMRVPVWEFISVCLGFAVMRLFIPLIKQTSV